MGFELLAFFFVVFEETEAWGGCGEETDGVGGGDFEGFLCGFF